MRHNLFFVLAVLAACVSAVFLGCALMHRAPATPCQNMICEAVDFGDAVRIQVCAGPADLQRIHSEARQLRALKARQGGNSQTVPPGTPGPSPSGTPR